MNDKVKELIELYEAILHGANDNMGLFDCYDTYYKGCWDEELEKVENLKQALTLPDVVKPFYCGAYENHNAGRCKNQCRLCSINEEKK